MYADPHEVPDEILTHSKYPLSFPDNETYFLSLLMLNYKIFSPYFLAVSFMWQSGRKSNSSLILLKLLLPWSLFYKVCPISLGIYILTRDKMVLSITAISTVYPQELQKTWTVARTGRWTVITINFSNLQLASSSGYQTEKSLEKDLMGCTFAEYKDVLVALKCLLCRFKSLLWVTTVVLVTSNICFSMFHTS